MVAFAVAAAACQAPGAHGPSGAYIAALGKDGAAPALLIWLDGGRSGWIYDPPGADELQVRIGPSGAVAFSSSADHLRFQGAQDPDGALRGQLYTSERDSWARSFGLTRRGRPVTWLRPKAGPCPFKPGRYNRLKYVPSEGEWIGAELFVFGCGKGGIVGLMTPFAGDSEYSEPLRVVTSSPGTLLVATLDASIRMGVGPEYSRKEIRLVRVAHGIELRPAQSVLDGPEVLRWRGPVSALPKY